MATKTARTGTAPFAHLLALVTGKTISGKRAEDDELDDTPDAEEDEEEREAEDDRPEEGAEDEETDEPEKGKKAKRAKAESEDEDEERAEDDDDDEEMAKARSEGFAAAQARGRRIFSAASAGARPDMAAHLAFNETMPAAKAIAMLDMAAAGVAPERGSRLGRRMSRVEIPNPGTGGSGRKSEDASFGEIAKAAGKKAGIF